MSRSMLIRRLLLLLPAVTIASAALAQGKDAGKAAAASGAPRVQFVTTEGRFTIELDAAKAPKTVANFLEYVRAGFYDGTTFHRVIETFMVQGGGFTPDMAQKPTRAPIPAESTNGLKNERGAIAMARTSDPNSATSQFFINVVDNPRLDYPSFDGTGYTVFGRVVEGMDVVDKIKAAPTGSSGGHQNVPLKPIVIQSAKIL